MKSTVNNTHYNFEFDAEQNLMMVNGKKFSADKIQVSENEFHVLHNAQSFNIEVIDSDTTAKEFTIRVNGNKFKVVVRDKYDELLHALGMDKAIGSKINDLKAPMPGLVLDVLVSAGNKIKKGDSLIVLEAMKMENILKATADAVVKNICVSKGARVEKNEILIELQ